MTAEPADDTSPVPVPDKAMFHGILGEICAAAAPYTEADPVGILVTLLAGCGVLIGPDTYVDVGSSRHRILIWPMLFGSSGTGRKGEATNTGMLFLNNAFTTLRDKTVTGLSSGEGLIEAIRDPETIEGPKGKEPILLGTEDKRLLCIETEFSAVMSRAAREGNTLNSILRQAWDGGDLMVLNRSQLRASGSHIGILGHVTPKEFVAKLARSDMAGGLYNRFLPVWVDRARRLPVPERVPLTALTALSARLHTQIDLAQRQTEVRLSYDAEQLWKEEIYDALTPDVDDREDLASEFTRRAQPYCRRLAALYCLLDLYPMELNLSERSVMVEVEHLQAAYALVRYSMDSANYILGAVVKDRALDRLIRAVLTSADGLSRDQIRDLFSRHKSSSEIDLMLYKLELDGRFEVLEESSGGRPRTIVRSARKAPYALKAVEAPEAARYARKVVADQALDEHAAWLDLILSAEPTPEEDL